MSRQSPSSTQSASTEEAYLHALESLKQIYKNKIKPVETMYNFEGFHSSPLTARDIDAKPMVLLLGQYSTGKTTFIKHLLGKQYPGAHVGMEPTTDKFVAVMTGPEDRVIPGNAAAVSGDLPFGGLQRFGSAFLSRFQVSQVDSPILRNMTLIDTPGILSGDKQRIDSRGYDFAGTCEWFASRADIILVLFDGHKLDISDELRGVLTRLNNHIDKVRVVLNKCDQISGQQLLRVYGAMMWSLGKVILTPEVIRVYLGSFWSEPPGHRFDDCRELLEAEQRDLITDLEDLPRYAAIRKVNEIIKRARTAKVHAYIIAHLKKEMPAMFGKQGKQEKMAANLELEFRKVQRQYHLAPGDFPNVDLFRQALEGYKFQNFASFNSKALKNLDEALSRDFPTIMTLFPANSFPGSSNGTGSVGSLGRASTNPFDSVRSGGGPGFGEGRPCPPDYDSLTPHDRVLYVSEFEDISGGKGRVLGSQARAAMERSGLSPEVLGKIWTLADWDKDGALDQDQWVVAMHYCKVASRGGTVPDRVPHELVPARNG